MQMAALYPSEEEGVPGWGRWFRLVDLIPGPDAEGGHVVMSGLDERPLLVLQRQGEGRVALMASDHACSRLPCSVSTKEQNNR